MGPFLKKAGDLVRVGTDKIVTNQQNPMLGEVSNEMDIGNVVMKLKGECRE